MGIPKDIILLFMYWFCHSCGIVVWKGFCSAKFKIKNGARKGGICSCWMFNVYINDLIRALESSGLGCHIRGVFAGRVLYADDILLLSGSLIKFQIMIHVCNDFANLTDLTFNIKKTECFAIGALCENAIKMSIFWE